MSTNGTGGKTKLRPGRRSLRSESGSEIALRRSLSNHDEQDDYEISPSPTITTQYMLPTNPAHSTSTESVRHLSLNVGNSPTTDDPEPPPATPVSTRGPAKYATTRELPKNWSDDESASTTEQESIKSDDFLPLKSEQRLSARMDVRPDRNGARRSSVQETVFAPLSATSSDSPRRASLQDGEKIGPDTSRSNNLDPVEKHKPERKRSSAHARSSPRVERKHANAYSTIVAKEKLDRSSKELLQWVQKTLSSYKSISVTSWDSFKDGVVLIHLIHSCDSSAVDLEQFDMSEPLRTLEAAFDLAETRLGIPNALDAKLVSDSKLNDNGADLRTFMFYISHFRTVYQERHRNDNPVSTVMSLVADLKSMVSRKVAQVELLNEEFDAQSMRLTALTTQDELQAERAYLQQRALTMDRMVEWGRQLNSELEAQNMTLREQNRLLNERIAHLTRGFEQEKAAKDAALAQLDMTERMKAMAELLQEPDLDKYIEIHKDDIERITAELSESTKIATSSSTDISAAP